MTRLCITTLVAIVVHEVAMHTVRWRHITYHLHHTIVIGWSFVHVYSLSKMCEAWQARLLYYGKIMISLWWSPFECVVHNHSVNAFINIITVQIHNLVKIYSSKLHNYIYVCTEFCVVKHIKYFMQCGKKCGWLSWYYKPNWSIYYHLTRCRCIV